MHHITKKHLLKNDIYTMTIYAPKIAHSCFLGQFIVAKTDAALDHMALTIFAYDRFAGTVTVIFQATDLATKKLADFNVGDTIPELFGPAGSKTALADIPLAQLKQSRILFVTDGIGAACSYSEIKWLRDLHCAADCILCNNSSDMLIFEDKLFNASNDLYVVTKDGSAGEKNDAVGALSELMRKKQNYDIVVAIGSTDMMKELSLYTKALRIPTIVHITPVNTTNVLVYGSYQLNTTSDDKLLQIDDPDFYRNHMQF